MKNKHHITSYIGVGLIVGAVLVLFFTILTGLGNWKDESNIFLVIGLIMLVVGIIMFSIGTNAARKICDRCGSSLNGCAYEYREKRRYSSRDAVVVEIEFTAECPECGAIKRMVKSFRITDGSDNINYQIDKFCESTFGH